MACGQALIVWTCGELAVLTDWELWAVANAVLQQHGEGAPRFVAERLAAVAADRAGVATWLEVGRRIGQLNGPPSAGLHS